MTCTVLVADPPWAFRDKLPGETRGASSNYSTLSTRELCRFPLPEMADHATLYMWRVSSMQIDALEVASAWGFIGDVVFHAGAQSVEPSGPVTAVAGAHDSAASSTGKRSRDSRPRRLSATARFDSSRSSVVSRASEAFAKNAMSAGRL